MKTVVVALPCLLTGGTEIQTLNLVHALIGNQYSVAVACYFEYSIEMVERFKNAGAEVVLFSNQNSTRPSGAKTFQFLYKRFKKVLKEYKPHIIHVQYMAPGALPILALQSLGFKSIIATSHTSGDIYGKNLWLPRLIARQFVKVFTCVSEAAERSFFGSSSLFEEHSAIPGNRHLTIHNCLPPTFKKPVLKKEQPGAKFIIGAVSRLDHIKGIDILLKAFAEMLKTTGATGVELQIAGDGREKENLRLLAKELGIEDNIQWMGLLHHIELANFYSSCDVIVVPSRSEGFGLTAIEAMAYGIPVIASNTGGLPEIITHGKTGLLFPPEDIHALSSALCFLADNTVQREKMGHYAQELSDRFSFRRYSERILNLYSRLS